MKDDNRERVNAFMQHAKNKHTPLSDLKTIQEVREEMNNVYADEGLQYFEKESLIKQLKDIALVIKLAKDNEILNEKTIDKIQVEYVDNTQKLSRVEEMENELLEVNKDKLN